MPNNFQVGIKKIPLHLFGFGVPFGLLAWYGGWGTAATLVAWRTYEEFLDWKEGRDTLGKAVIDLLSQVVGAVVVAVIRGALA